MGVLRGALGGGLLLVVAGAGVAWAQPKIETGPRTVDLGARLNYRDMECRFTFSNAGTSLLEVSVKKASCGCTTHVLSGDTVAPGQSGEMLLTHKVKKQRVRTGPQSWRVELATNDPQNESVVLTANVKLVDQVHVEPESIALSAASVSAPLRVVCMDDEGTAEVLAVEPSAGCVAVEKLGVESRDGATFHEYSVSRVPSVPLREPLSIRVRTNSARVPVIEVPVKVWAERLVGAKPERVLFGIVKPGSMVEKTVALKANDLSANVARCTSSDSAIASVLEKGAGEGDWLLTVKLTAPAVSAVKTIKAEVAVQDDAGQWLCTVPVMATVSP